jgi:predicted transcriptional regulator
MFVKVVDLTDLAENEPKSVRALARALDLDKGIVSRDLRELAELELLSTARTAGQLLLG